MNRGRRCCDVEFLRIVVVWASLTIFALKRFPAKQKWSRGCPYQSIATGVGTSPWGCLEKNNRQGHHYIEIDYSVLLFIDNNLKFSLRCLVKLSG